MRDPAAGLFRAFSWGMVGVLVAFLLEVYLVFVRGWNGAGAALRGAGGGPALLVLAAYVLGALAGPAVAFLRDGRPLRPDYRALSELAGFIARAAFFAVVFVGIADLAISFLRTESLLAGLVGEALAANLGLSRWRGPNVHLPLILLGVLAAALTPRRLGFIWLGLLVVIAELALVIGRFVFSYEQAFMADLVRLWYAGLFLFAAAYTLVEDGHVRVDVFYAAMGRRARAVVNGAGSVLLGMVLCWTILLLGMSSPASTITAPLLAYEIGQQGSGMFTKYLMAGYLGLFAVLMLVQFAGYLLKAVADWRGEPDPEAEARASQALAGH